MQTIISYSTKNNPYNILNDYTNYCNFHDKTFKCKIIQAEVSPERAIATALKGQAVQKTINVSHAEIYANKGWQRFSTEIVKNGTIITQKKKD